MSFHKGVSPYKCNLHLLTNAIEEGSLIGLSVELEVLQQTWSSRAKAISNPFLHRRRDKGVDVNRVQVGKVTARSLGASQVSCQK